MYGGQTISYIYFSKKDEDWDVIWIGNYAYFKDVVWIFVYFTLAVIDAKNPPEDIPSGGGVQCLDAHIRDLIHKYHFILFPLTLPLMYRILISNFLP